MLVTALYISYVKAVNHIKVVMCVEGNQGKALSLNNFSYGKYFYCSNVVHFMYLFILSLEHKTSHKCQFYEIEIYASCER